MVKFYEMSVEERQAWLKEQGLGEALELYRQGLSMEKADAMLENVIATVSLPLGLLFIRINGKDRIIPMALEEPSVVAGANKAAKLTLEGGFKAWADESVMIGQVQVLGSPEELLPALEELREELEGYARELTKGMARYGGGFRELWFKPFHSAHGPFVVLYFSLAVGDAMGANRVNTVAEELGNFLKAKGFDVNVRILSNLAVKRMARAKALWEWEALEKDAERKGFDAKRAVRRFLMAYELALQDPFRLATNNKGIMNGIDAVALAFGQDFRAIEAAAHTYSAVRGLKPLATWWESEKGLEGYIELPLAVGVVGGAVKSLPHAQASFKLSGISTAQELAEVMAAVGLANNFAAIYAIVTEGINRGHMKLHARNIALMLGATPEEAKKVAEIVDTSKPVNMAVVREALERLRS